MSEKIPSLVPVDFDPFADGEVVEHAAATFAQLEVWAASQLGPEASCAYNESVSLRCRGPLDEEAMLAAVDGIWRRHEALRSSFSTDGRTCVVAEPRPLVVRRLRHTAEEHAAFLRAEVSTPFDLEHGPLFRAALVRLGDGHWELVLTAHHIVCDGWSFAVLFQDLGSFYSAHRARRTPELPPAPRYSDYARAELASSGQDDAFWLDVLAGAPAALELPGDRPRPPLRTTRAGRVDHELGPELVASLKKVGARSGGGASFFVTLFAAFDAFVYRLSGQSDLVVGVPAAGQSRTGQDQLVGHCVSLLPIRATFRGGDRFSDFLRAHRKAVLDAYDHQNTSFGHILEKLKLPRDHSRVPLVPLMFNLEAGVEGPQGLSFTDLEVDFFGHPRTFENFELSLNCVDTKKRVRVECQYNADLFDEDTIRAWLASFETMLGGIVASPDATIDELPVLSPAEQAQQLGAWQGSEAAIPDSRIHELFEAQAERTPEAVAVRAGGEAMTYAEVERQANQLAHALRGLGVGRGKLVGLCVDRSARLPVALLGVLKAGAAYVPLDPDFPRDRLAFMAEDAQLDLIVTESALAGDLPAGRARLYLLDEEAAALAAAPSTRPAAGTGAEEPAYVIYTSGSTGRPKGVVLPHRAVANLIASSSRTPGMQAGDVVVAVTTISFDIAVFELFLPLAVGATIVLASRDTASDGLALRELVEAARPTVLQLTPASWRALIAAGWKGDPALRLVCGGEALSRDLAAELLERGAALWNAYGPTETCVWSAYQKLEPGAPITVGRPIANTRVHVVDENLRLRPTGVPGELCIGGAGLALAYFRRPELTAERFVPDPHVEGGGRMYRTGDLVRWRRDGSLEYLRRNDTQVKVRGFRIELGEIEAVLVTHPAVRQAVVTVVEERTADARIVAYVIPAAGESLTITELRKHLRKKLPDYMIPQALVELEAFPLTPNGKIDRKRLPTPGVRREAQEHVPPRSDAEKLVAELWSGALKLERVSVHENFFELGGHSLLAIEVIARLAERTGRRLSPRVMLLANLAEVAREVAGN